MTPAAQPCDTDWPRGRGPSSAAPSSAGSYVTSRDLSDTKTGVAASGHELSARPGPAGSARSATDVRTVTLKAGEHLPVVVCLPMARSASETGLSAQQCDAGAVQGDGRFAAAGSVPGTGRAARSAAATGR